MGLGRNIGNLLVAQIALSVPSILQQRSLDLLSPQNCTKSSLGKFARTNPRLVEVGYSEHRGIMLYDWEKSHEARMVK